MSGWSLRDRAFLITGGARGIGAATAQALHARGARLALVDLDEAALEGGYIAFTASAATFSHAPGMGAYAATKAGVEALANALRTEVAPSGVDVGTIHPIWIDTDMVREADASTTAFQRMRESLPGPLHTTHPVSKTVDAIVRGFERRSRRVFVPEWVRVLHWTRAAIHTPLAERPIVRDVPEVLAAYERDAREKGPDEVAWSERTRDVLRGG
jgi:short-subunit dehydrogenase